MPSTTAAGGRDPRVDFLRGIALLSIFVDHIPDNRVADFTLHNLGFSDAGELFVFLAGFSAMMAYGRVFERDGAKSGLAKVAVRCLKIYGVQVALLLLTLLIVKQWGLLFRTAGVTIAPVLQGGLKGAFRGVTLGALPEYLDILPLYIVLLAAFPLIRFGLTRSIALTLGLSVLLHGAANVMHWNLPSVVDPAAPATWYFNPFTWQLVFVCGAIFAVLTRRQVALVTRPPKSLLVLCWLYLLVAFLAVDAWKLWPQPLGPNVPSTNAPFAIFGNEPKSFVTPWRLAHILALATVALTAPRFAAFARLRCFEPVVACGRQSLNIFALGCVLALFGRLIFKTYGVTLVTGTLVNAGGLALMLLTGFWLERHRLRAGISVPTPAPRSAEPVWPPEREASV